MSAKSAAKRPATKSPATAARAAERPATEPVVDMEEAIRILQTSRPTFYRWLREGRLKGMKVGRQWRFYRSDLARFLEGEGPRIELPVSPLPLLTALATRLHQPAPAATLSPGDQLAAAVDLMLALAGDMRASDLHLAPTTLATTGAVVVPLRYRVDGVLHEIATIDPRLLPALVERWKNLVACNPDEKARPQDGRLQATLKTTPERAVDVRVSFIPTPLGESVTARFLDRATLNVSLEHYNWLPATRAKLMRALGSGYGLVIVAGPTGSGKTTTLYAALAAVTKPECKVVSVEDPVEYLLPGVVQTQVNAAAGLTFAAAMRAQLRSDPDVILVGELRDRETLEISIQAALTGHLVLSTLHALDSFAALQRLVDLGVAPWLIGDTARLIVGQRLVRRVCRACRRAVPIGAAQLASAVDLVQGAPLPWTSTPATFYEAVGCAECRQTGYRGRAAITELLEFTPELSAALRRGEAPEALRPLALRQGCATLAMEALRLTADGTTTLDEAYRVCASR